MSMNVKVICKKKKTKEYMKILPIIITNINGAFAVCKKNPDKISLK